MGNYSFDAAEFVIRLTKYALEGLVVSVAAFFFPATRLDWPDIMLIGLSAACSFAMLDFFAPGIGASARQGAGFGIGANIVGFPAGAMGR